MQFASLTDSCHIPETPFLSVTAKHNGHIGSNFYLLSLAFLRRVNYNTKPSILSGGRRRKKEGEEGWGSDVQDEGVGT